MLKHAWLIGLTLALCGATQGGKKTQDPKPKEPLAVVLSVSGAVQIVRAGGKKTEKAAPGAPLLQGDRVKTSKQSKATLILSNGKTVEVAASQSFILKPLTSNKGSSPIPLELFRALVAKLRSVSDREGAIRPPATRGNGKRDTLTLIHPREFEDASKPVSAFVRADAPTFTWTPVIGAQTYHFTVFQEGRPLFERTLDAAAIKSLVVEGAVVYRPTELNLTPGRSYSWRVEARFAQGAKSETRSFTVLTEESTTKLKEALEGLDTSGVRGTARSIVCGAYLESNHLFADAAAEYLRATAANPEQSIYRQLLADLLDRSGLYELADSYRLKPNADK